MRRLIALVVLAAPMSVTASLDQPAFQACLEDLRTQAVDQGIDRGTVDAAFAGLELQERVLELDRSQPEFLQTFGQYLGTRVTDSRVERGRELLREHAALLEQIHATYGVQPHYLVALWGLETNFGSYFGTMPVLDSLATLACDQRRSDYFTGELVEALRILDAGHIDQDSMRGSWAGAMGHTQFMPSTFTRYAVDGSGNGRIDLWNDLEDVFASSANYLARIGWRDGERWGREVRIPDGFDWSQADGRERRSVRAWADKGVRAADGTPLPDSDIEAALIVPAGHQGPAFLVYNNFRQIMRWNTSTSYALAVGHLADRIAGMGTLHTQPPDETALRREEVKEMQQRLNALGFDSGRPDGIAGRMTRSALREFQLSRDLPADGHPNQAMLQALRR